MARLPAMALEGITTKGTPKTNKEIFQAVYESFASGDVADGKYTRNHRKPGEP